MIVPQVDLLLRKKMSHAHFLGAFSPLLNSHNELWQLPTWVARLEPPSLATFCVQHLLLFFEDVNCTAIL